MINVWIPGHPRTKGSLDEFHQDTPQSKRWRQLMAYALRYAKDPRGSDVARHVAGVPVAVRATFWLPTGDATTPNCGDLDKLARNLLDAGTDADTYADDVQVVRLFTDKMACTAGDAQGVLVTIWAPDPWELNDWIEQAGRARTVAMEAQGLLS
jgi:Holliday junction resolvase RusA-like endonuclease